MTGKAAPFAEAAADSRGYKSFPEEESGSASLSLL